MVEDNNSITDEELIRGRKLAIKAQEARSLGARAHGYEEKEQIPPRAIAQNKPGLR